MEFKLEYIVNDERKVFNLTSEEVLVGKLSTNDLQLFDNSVSRDHCKFIRHENSYLLVDLNSTNGTFVNGRRVFDKTLEEGDTITIGRTTLTFLGLPKEETFSEDDGQRISMVIPLSDKFSVAKQDQDAAREITTLKFLTSLTLLGKELIASSSLEETFERVGELIFQFLNPKRLFIFSCRQNQDDLHLVYSHNRQGKIDNPKVNISKTIAMKAINEKVAILSSNTMDDARFDGAQSIIMYGITSAVSVPIWTKNSIYGLIYVDTTEFDQMFKEKELEVLSIIANFTGLSVEGINSMKKLDREKKIRSRLERYFSPAVVSRIMESHDSSTMELNAYKETEASVLFMDIVGFTTKVENMNAMEVGIFLNDFFTKMTDVIFQHNGTLDKYIGDCIMAVFGAPLPMGNHAQLSIITALDMMAKLDEANAQLPETERIKIRIGINSGKLVAGDFGSPKRYDYTVIGNTVNVASRLEAKVAKHNQIVVSEDTYRYTKDLFLFEPLGEQKLDGLSVPVNAYRVIKRKEG